MNTSKLEGTSLASSSAGIGQLPARLSPLASFFLMASITVTFLAGASAPTR